MIEDNKKDNKQNFENNINKNSFNFNLDNTINNLNNSQKENELIINYNEQNKYENILSKTVNRKYDIKLKKGNFDINYANNSIDNIQINNNNYNKI